MYPIYHPLITEKRSSWRSAYEVKVAALQHEKRRLQQQMQEFVGLAKPQTTHLRSNRKTKWVSLLKLPLRLLANLMG